MMIPNYKGSKIFYVRVGTCFACGKQALSVKIIDLKDKTEDEAALEHAAWALIPLTCNKPTCIYPNAQYLLDNPETK